MLVIALAAAFLVAWTALYVLVIRPKLEAFRATAGIYAKLDRLEAGLWPRLALWLRGLKVALVGFVTSAAPLAAVAWDKLAGIDWTQFLAAEKAKVAAALVTALGILGPMLMVALHNGALADAAAIEPQAPRPRSAE